MRLNRIVSIVIDAWYTVDWVQNVGTGTVLDLTGGQCIFRMLV